MNYEQLSLEELNILSCKYFLFYRDTGGTHESDTSINDISRTMVKKYHEKKGCCYLGKINQPEKLKEGEKAQFITYQGQLITNFEYDIIVPHADENLLNLLTEHNLIRKTYDSLMTLNRIDSIITRVYEIGGLILIWV